jgi:hypothetical protein
MSFVGGARDGYGGVTGGGGTDTVRSARYCIVFGSSVVVGGWRWWWGRWWWEWLAIGVEGVGGV